MACLCATLALHAYAAADEVRLLQSARGDHIALDDRALFTCATLPCPVRLCLSAPAAGAAKALSISTDAALARRVEPGGVGCIDVAPVPHRLTFWAEDSTGEMGPVMVVPMDLRGRSGSLIWANWLQDAELVQMDRP